MPSDEDARARARGSPLPRRDTRLLATHLAAQRHSKLGGWRLRCRRTPHLLETARQPPRQLHRDRAAGSRRTSRPAGSEGKSPLCGQAGQAEAGPWVKFKPAARAGPRVHLPLPRLECPGSQSCPGTARLNGRRAARLWHLRPLQPHPPDSRPAPSAPALRSRL